MTSDQQHYDPCEMLKKIEIDRGLLGGSVNHIGGERNQKIIETVNRFNQQAIAAALFNQQAMAIANASNKFAWLSTSCAMHSFLVSSTFTSETVDCNSGDIVCEGNATGVQVDFYRGQKLILWNSPEIWTTECVNGSTLMLSLIGDFLVEQKYAGMVQSTVGEDLFIRFGDDCVGPNCIGPRASGQTISSCQHFLEVEQSFETVPGLMKWLFAKLFAVGSFLGYFARFKPNWFGRSSKEKGERKLRLFLG